MQNNFLNKFISAKGGCKFKFYIKVTTEKLK